MASGLLTQQTFLYGVIARAIVNMKKLGHDKITLGTVESRIAQVDRNWEKFEDNHTSLLEISSTTKTLTDDDYFQSDLFSTCEESYMNVKAQLLDMRRDFLSAATAATSGATNVGQEVTSPGRSKQLPKITLPKFGGKYTEWTPFKDMFVSIIIDNSDLTPVERLHYLKTNLIGDAAKLVASIPVTADNFERAWTKLTTRYENKRALINAQLDILFNLKPLTKKCAKDLEILRATVSEVLEALEALGGPVDQWDYFLVYFVCRRLDSETHEDWEVSLGGNTDPPTYQDLNDFLASRVRALETVDARSPSIRVRPHTHSSVRSSSTMRTHTVTSSSASSSPSPCCCCGANHSLFTCASFKTKTPAQRYEFCASKRLCFNCLGAHRRSACRSNKRCLVCNKSHHSSLHDSFSETLTSSVPSTTQPSTQTAVTHVATTSSSRVEAPPGAAPESASAVSHHVLPSPTVASSSTVLLATAIVTVSSEEGRELKARALIDQGSELSFVSEALVQLLQLPRRKSAISLYGVGAQKQTTTRGSALLTFRGQADDSPSYAVDAHILPRISGRIPASPVSTQPWNHLSGLELADPTFHVPGFVEILLGANIYGQLMLEGLRKSDPTSPIAQLTTLGWIISGPVLHPNLHPPVSAHGLFCSIDADLHNLVHDFWSQEIVAPPTKGKIPEDEESCESQFVQTHSREKDGRYVVRLPFRVEHTSFGDSKSAATRALSNTHRRFQRDPKFRELYVDFLEEYEKLNHMQKVEANQADARYFLPHHGVLRESSITTKLRVVFNGSQKTNLGISLNDTLHAGPKLQQDLCDVLLRWRVHPVVFSSDVEKMYRQIWIHPDDRPYQCILWSADPRDPPTAYQLSTVTYGLTCAPYLAIRTLHQLACDYEEQFPQAAAVIRRNVYVDDVLSGSDSPELARESVRQVDGLFSAGGFCLKKWVSNDPSVLTSIEEDRQLNVEKHFEEHSVLKALGLRWSPTSDALKFEFHREELSEATVTKRSVLSLVAKLFDPLGWLAPIIVLAKIFLQSLWTSNLQWDDPLPPPLLQRWTEFTDALRSASAFSIPRWLGTLQSSIIELHGFSDASRLALGAVIYVRVIEEDFSVRSTLLVAKTKVAPLKQVTIARLELSAAVLLAQLTSRIRQCLAFERIPVHLWTDSTVALVWIRGHPSKWKEFVGNRVALIQELVPDGIWRHVAGSDNPADVASRGMTPVQLQECRSWWNGPSWLAKPSVSWPQSSQTISGDTNLEERPSVAHTATRNPEPWDLITRYSSLNRLLRVTALVLLAVARFRGQNPPPDDRTLLSPSQLDQALRFWLIAVQSQHFESTIQLLKRKEDLPRSNQLLRLTPFVDQEGLLRVGGRLGYSSLNEDGKHPIIIPRSSSLTTLLIAQAHQRTLHGGVQLTLSTLRQKYWIIGGRSSVRVFIARCVICVKQRGETIQQKMGQIPISRVNPARPFLHSGVDYAGPFVLKTWKGRGAKTYKAFLIVFVCFTTSAVHLELATDYSTDGFLAAYKRFTSRRGVCSTLRSDCGTNFIGADAELRRMFTAASEDFSNLRATLANDRTEWYFNPPAAPHFGGKWEAAVKSAKHHIRRVIGDAQLTYEEFSSLLVQIEGVLNSRPLCPLSDDPTDLTALTPGHFLIGDAITSVPEASLCDVPYSRLSHWQKIRHMIEHFWNRWSKEYLQRLLIGNKWHLPSHKVSVGSLVLLADERYPPAKWPLARVTELHPGSDSLVRVVSVRTSSGSILKRPVVKLCLLPVSDAN